MNKRSKHIRYDDPSAFRQRFPRIIAVEDGSMVAPLGAMMAVKIYTMGKCKIILHAADENAFWFMSIRRNDRYPSWDEIVWARYNLIPDAALMSLLLPNLNAYINQEDSEYKNVFTMEQKGWALNPFPTHCDKPMVIESQAQTQTAATFYCEVCRTEMLINFNTWNELHGNGFRAGVVK